MSTVCMRAHAPKELEEHAIFTTAVVITAIETVSSTGALKEPPLQVGHLGHRLPILGDAFLSTWIGQASARS